MKCRDCADFLADYIAGELPADVRATFERHLSLCRNCVTYLEQYRATMEATKTAFISDKEEASADFPEELVQAILSARRSRSADS